MSEQSLYAEERGFEGSVSNLLLTDVLQLEGQNRFSGSITVTWSDREGRLYFQGGEIVHAEAGGLEGEIAVLEIIGWPQGTFSVHQNVSTFSRTIHKRLSHLLLDVHAQLDDIRAGRVHEPLADDRRPAEVEERRMTIAERIRNLADVSYAVLMSPNGTPVDDASHHAEALAARGLFLATLMGAPVGSAFGLGELQSVALHSSREPLLLFHLRDQFLCVSVLPGTSLEETEIAVRQIVSQRAPERVP